MEIKDLTSYRIIEQKSIADLDCEAFLLEHVKTKAKVVLLPNNDDNKVFYIGFRTPPKDSKGSAHIVEHSVLCGSEKYPIKDPFVELCKGSLNTFLNAMTYPDKTIYPVASCNDKDFANLVDVYLDAVFHPNMYRNEKIFMQEGWHYEMEDAESELKYNGVVYSEMKGVYSSAEEVVRSRILKELFPNGTYGVESGGDPDDIPTLTYEEFLDFHSKYYHPSNSYIYLYGDMDMVEKLEYIDREYLSHYDYLEVDSDIVKQEPIGEVKETECFYPITDDESEEANTYLSYNVLLGCDNTDPEMNIAMSTLESVLCQTPGAPIKKALIEKGIGSDVSCFFENELLQPYCSIMVYNAEPEMKDEFVKTIEDTLREQIEKGIDKKALLASLVNSEFSYREADFGALPKGLAIGVTLLDSWLYDKTRPFVYIEQGELYRKLKQKVETRYFEDIVEKYLLNNTHKVILAGKPKKGLATEKEEKLAAELAEIKNGLSKEEIDRIVVKTAELKEYQGSEDSPEDLAKMPFLRREDMNPNARKMEVIADTIEGCPFYKYDIFTNGIGYLRLGFRTDNIPLKYYRYVNLFSYCFMKMDTTKHSYNDFYNEIKLYTGGLYMTGVAYRAENLEKPDKFAFEVKARFLDENLKDTFRLIEEAVFDTRFEDKVRLKELMNERYSRLKSMISEGGHMIAMNECAGAFSVASALDCETSGVAALKLLEEITADFDSKCDEIIDIFNTLRKMIFRPENAYVSYIAPDGENKELKECFRDFKTKLYTDEVESGRLTIELLKSNNAYKTSGQIQFVGFSGRFTPKYEYSGVLAAVKTMLNYDYLWTNVRVKGGAYGCFPIIRVNGILSFVSFRDPNLEKTIEVFKGIADYLKNVSLDEKTITRYIIGAIGELDTPFSPSLEGDIAISQHICGTHYEDIQRRRDELLAASENDIRDAAKFFEEAFKTPYLKVVGSAKAIAENESLFDSVESLLR